MAARTLAVIAAVLFVATFALATLGPYDLSLGRAIYLVDQDLLGTLQPGLEHYGAHWVWDRIVVPFLVRPVWLLPAALTLLCAGGAATMASVGTRRSHRRRS
jgi:hypothetical protein